MPIQPETIGKRIKTIRKAKGLSQNELGALVGVSGTAIMRYEKGEREPKIQLFRDIAKALSVSEDYLLLMTDDPTPKGDFVSTAFDLGVDEYLRSHQPKQSRQENFEQNLPSQEEINRQIAEKLETTPSALKGDADAMKIARGTEPLQSKANSAIAHREKLSEEILADWEQNKDAYLSNIQSAKDNLIRVAERICTNVQETDDEAQRISDKQWLPTRLNMISEFISANEKTLHMAFPGWRDPPLPQTSSDPNKE